MAEEGGAGTGTYPGHAVSAHSRGICDVGVRAGAGLPAHCVSAKCGSGWPRVATAKGRAPRKPRRRPQVDASAARRMLVSLGRRPSSVEGPAVDGAIKVGCVWGYPI